METNAQTETKDDLLYMDIFEELLTLTAIEREFLMEWFKDQNAAAAARRIEARKLTPDNPDRKYPSQLGYLIINKPNVRRIADAYTRQKLKSMDATVDRILQELSCLAFASLPHFIKWEGNRVTVRSMDDIPEALYPAIKKITRRETEATTTIEFELHDKTKALELLGKFHTMFKDKVDSTVNMQVGGVLRVPAPLSAEQWEKNDGQNDGEK